MRWTWCVIAGVLAGCDSGAPDCGKAVSAATKLTSNDPMLGKLLTDSCEGGWTGMQRNCVAAAKSVDGVIACVPELKAVAEPILARAASAKAQAEADKVDVGGIDSVKIVEQQLDELNDKVSKAIYAVADAQSDADRATAKATLVALQKQKYEFEKQIAELKADATRKERAKGVHISKECLDNPLAKGCQ